MNEPEFLSRFTTHLKEVLRKALAFALRSGRHVVEPGDLLVGLLQEHGSIGSELLHKSSLTLSHAEECFSGLPSAHQSGSVVAPDLSMAVKQILEKSVMTAHANEHRYVGTEHLLFALLDSNLSDIQQFLLKNKLNIEHTREQLINIFKSTTKFPDLSHQPVIEDVVSHCEESVAAQLPDVRHMQQQGQRPRALELFARELTSIKTAAKLDPVIGRDMETDRIIEILCRRMKNNPVLLGDPGVGKTAIVEGLAQRLVSGDVPDALQGKRIFAVDLAMMVAGTMYRGEFEARIKSLVEEVRTEENIILFIDEIHNIVGAGSTSGSLDAANILKPALARGEIRCIGATTWAEYKKHIEPDAALERRYQPVEITEPTQEQTLAILKGLQKKYEDHHGVRFAQGSLEVAVRLAERYITERFFPDKAVDLLDEAAAHVNAKRRSQDCIERLRALDIALAVVQGQKEKAVKTGSLSKATKILKDEKLLREEKKRVELQMQRSRNKKRPIVQSEHVAAVVARLSRVSAQTILANDREQLSGIEARLSEIIFGQPQAVAAVAETIRKSRLGFSDPKRPRGSLLFVGPSGVGKSELAHTLALELYGREDALVKLDMSEFAESHSVSKMLGSPAGYVGYREGNRLTDAIRKNPQAILLFDEFEKAHVDVQHLLLQALEDGKLSDSTGRPISLRHSYIILTSNIGADFVNRAGIGFNSKSNKDSSRFEELIREQLKERFRPELLNRLDRIVVFQPLSRDTMRKIIQREMSQAMKRLQETQQIAYSVTGSVVEWLLAREMKSEEGARAARRVVERELLSVIGNALVERPHKRKWNIKIEKEKLKVV